MTRSDVWWCGLAPLGPLATIVKSTLSWPVGPHRGGDVGGHLGLGAAGPQPLAHPGVHGVDGRAGPAQRLDLLGRLAHPQFAQHVTGQALGGAGQRGTQREHLLGPHAVGQADRAGPAERGARPAGTGRCRRDGR